jgi:hypothetical protein
MTRILGYGLGAVMLLLCAAPAARAQTAATAKDNGTAAAAFVQYDKIRVVLSADSLTGVPAAAQALAPLARQLASAPAGAAADKLAAARDLKDARAAFGTLSELLVPTFMAANLPGVHGFMCPMVNKPWAQQTATVQNPYYGKAMPGCGTEITPKK